MTSAKEQIQAAELRLAFSREKLRTVLAHYNKPVSTAHASATAPEPEEPGWLDTLSDVLSDVPAATVAVRWLRRWWARHPWRSTLDLAGAVTRELVEPVSKRHPWLLVAGAMVAGAALTRARPWRWISGSALLAGLLPPVHWSSVMNWLTAAMAHQTAQAQSSDEASSDGLGAAPVAPTHDAGAAGIPPEATVH